MTGDVFTIEELPIPAEPHGAGWPDFAASVDVKNTVEAAAYGTEELAFTAEELLPGWHTLEHAPRRLLIARLHGAVVGRAVYETLADPASGYAWFTAEVLPEFRLRGIGSSLATQLEAIADAENRPNRVVYAVSPERSDTDEAAPSAVPADPSVTAGGSTAARLTTPTGFGSIPLDNPEVLFLLHRGYRLEQVERGSRLALPVDPGVLAELNRTAAERAGDDYSMVTWAGRTPERWLEDFAALYTRMSTDAPTAGLEEPEDHWSVERLIADQAAAATGPRTTLVTAALHRPSGHLAGFTELSVPSGTGRAASQEDTLMLREHRGRRLGMLLKLANLHQLAQTFPEVPSVTTFNAEENRHMLDVNEALGFVPMGYEGAWRKITATVGSADRGATTDS
ncbi:GNAT family N-acetyltransferase [Cryobacterium sp.]|jgi:GNAT superfamily N-acetyltransferase|uniref:GNAT family N-acetyltransferase n=1 Tax=Cryobacterium sp. TaxID=1926290 RepID=UPI002601853E|nr:GNAT family N-acetyltransferase [Cryobacterium sp.]MCU1445846.1 family N-acetyltransferase [Cryobacterium sp.]